MPALGQKQSLFGTRPQAKKFGRRYPWADWFSKKKVILKRHRDYSCQSYIMAQMARNVARSRNYQLEIDVTIPDDSNSVVIRVLGKRTEED